MSVNCLKIFGSIACNSRLRRSKLNLPTFLPSLKNIPLPATQSYPHLHNVQGPENLRFATMKTARPLDSFSCLTFDCFGTLIDWETAIYKSLAPLTQQLSSSHPCYNNRLKTLKTLLEHEDGIKKAHPTAIYSRILADAYGNLAADWGITTTPEDQTRFGASIGEWPPFSDTISALQRLQKHFKLVILSNVDLESFACTLSGPLREIKFDAVYTAQDIGSYKPSLENFQYLIDHCRNDLGVKKEDIIHTAYSLSHDLVPATQIGLVSAWIERSEDFETVMGGKLEEYDGKVDFTWRFKNLVDMADVLDGAKKPRLQRK